MRRLFLPGQGRGRSDLSLDRQGQAGLDLLEAGACNSVYPKANRGATVRTFAATDALMDGTWSINVCNAGDRFGKSAQKFCFSNNRSARSKPYRSVTVQFGGGQNKRSKAVVRHSPAHCANFRVLRSRAVVLGEGARPHRRVRGLVGSERQPRRAPVRRRVEAEGGLPGLGCAARRKHTASSRSHSTVSHGSRLGGLDGAVICSTTYVHHGECWKAPSAYTVVKSPC